MILATLFELNAKVYGYPNGYTHAFKDPSIYTNKKANRIICGTAAGIFLGHSSVLRSQPFISDTIIPHHSLAILTGKRADISDKNVRKLAYSIIVSQQ